MSFKRIKLVGETPTPPAPLVKEGGAGGLPPAGSKNWDTCQLFCVMLERERKHSNNPSFLPHDVWQIVGDYFRDPFVVDAVPKEDLDRILRGIDKRLFLALMSIPGVYIAGGSTLPGVKDDEYDDLDFFIHGTPEYVEKVHDALCNDERGKYNEDDPFTKLHAVSWNFPDEYDIEERIEKRLYEYTPKGHPGFEGRRKIQLVIKPTPQDEEEGDLEKYEEDEARAFRGCGGFTPHCILRFPLDYQQCAFKLTSEGRFIRYRTPKSVLAHKTKIIRCVSNELQKPEKALKVIRKAFKKGYRFPEGVVDIRQLGTVTNHRGVLDAIEFSIEKLLTLPPDPKWMKHSKVEEEEYDMTKKIWTSDPDGKRLRRMYNCLTPLADFMTPGYNVGETPTPLSSVNSNDEMARLYMTVLSTRRDEFKPLNPRLWDKPISGDNWMWMYYQLRIPIKLAALGEFDGAIKHINNLDMETFRIKNHGKNPSRQCKDFITEVKKWIESIKK